MQSHQHCVGESESWALVHPHTPFLFDGRYFKMCLWPRLYLLTAALNSAELKLK